MINIGTKYSLTFNTPFTFVKKTMADKIALFGFESSFIKTENKTNVPESKLVNKTELVIAPEYVNDALKYFTDKTGIPVAITVDTMENVFGRTILTNDLIFVILAIGLIALAIFLIIKNIIESKKAKANDGGPNDDNIFDNTNFG